MDMDARNGPIVSRRTLAPAAHNISMGRLALVLLLPALAWPAERGDRAEYVGGTLGELPRETGRLDVTDEHFLRFHTRTAAVQVPYENINLLEYGQHVGRRYAMAAALAPVLGPTASLLALSKKRKHFLTIGYADDLGRQQALVFVVGKKQIRAVLASLEARTGRKVEYQDPEARKAGKG